MRHAVATLIAVFAASPAFAASGPFFSLSNTDFVVLVAFLIFVGVLLYFKVPSLLAGMLDKRSDDIRNELDEACAIREEAQSLLVDLERKLKEAHEQKDRIVAHAREEAAEAAEKAREDLKISVARRLKAAEEQIASAEANAIKEVRDSAISVAVEVAREIVADQMTGERSARLIEDAMSEVESKLH
ncbi:MAG: F0F1 ATP synthase subunit B [Roseovarius sp.]|nr:F0F1 ATP synthase subunit B [Roseovarius sp.]MCY4291734.1 F0F1 ATP synthase subunit B [Roseovarius sp.]